MIDIILVRDDKEAVITSLSRRGTDFREEIERIHSLDRSWRELLKESESLKAQKNRVSDKIGQLKRNKEDASLEIASMQEIASRIKELDLSIRNIKEDLDAALLLIPNITDPSIPYENKILREEGEEKFFDFEPRPHWELGEELDLMDLPAATSLSGSRFPLLKGKGCLLERGLARLMLDLHTGKHGYTEIMPPLLVKEEIMTGTGQLPKFKEDMYSLNDASHYLIPTAEVPLSNLAREKITDPTELPLKYTALTPCFRREAGSYGKDTSGLIRNHQFNKVELVNIVRAADSEKTHLELLKESEAVLRLLGLRYRVLLLGSSDTGFSAAKTYDLEVWMPGEKLWREVSSCSNCRDFQARRMEARTRSENSATEYLHTLNSSALAVGRIFAAVLENYQEKDGSVIIPAELRPYMNNIEKLS